MSLRVNAQIKGVITLLLNLSDFHSTKTLSRFRIKPVQASTVPAIAAAVALVSSK